MYMGTEKEEQGKVYVYSLNKVRMLLIVSYHYFKDIYHLSWGR